MGGGSCHAPAPIDRRHVSPTISTSNARSKCDKWDTMDRFGSCFCSPLDGGARCRSQCYGSDKCGATCQLRLSSRVTNEQINPRRMGSTLGLEWLAWMWRPQLKIEHERRTRSVHAHHFAHRHLWFGDTSVACLRRLRDYNRSSVAIALLLFIWRMTTGRAVTAVRRAIYVMLRSSLALWFLV